MNLHTTLEGYNSNVLKELLRHMGLNPATKKQSNIDTLLEHLPHPERIQLEQAKLNDAERLAVARIIFMGNSARAARLKNLLLQESVIKETPKSHLSYYPYEGKPSYSGTPAFEDLIAKLTKRGLVFSHTIADANKSVLSWSPGQTIFIPQPILKHIDESKLPTISNSVSFEPSFIRSGSVIDFQRDVSSYVRFARRIGTVKLTTQGVLYKTALREVAEFASQRSDIGSGMKETDNGYLFFLRRILREGQLLNFDYNGLTAADSSHPFWSMDSAERIRYTYQLWRNTTAWNGLRQVPAYHHGNDITSPAPDGLTAARQTVLDHIARLGTDWISVPALTNDIQHKAYGFLFPQREYRYSGYYYYNYDAHTARNSPYAYSNNPFGMGFEGMRDEEEGWDKVEAAYINHIIAGPLYWLGLVDLGYRGAPPEGDYKAVKPVGGYRLTSYGAWLIAGAEKPAVTQQEDAGGIILQPNFEILAMQPIPVDVLMTLDAFATVKDSQQHVTTYELTRDSVYRGQQGRWQVPAILKFFDEQSRMRVPDNVRRTLEEWDALHNRITIQRDVPLLNTADAETTASLAAALSQSRTVTETVLLSDLTYQHLANEVRQASYLPLQTRRANLRADNSIRIFDDGRIAFIHRVPSIFAVQQLADISVAIAPEQGEGAHRQLVPAMLKEYTNAGAHFNELIGRLKRLSKEPLSKQLTLNLKAWTHYFGDAKQEKLILIEFRDNKARDELCNDPDLREYLTPFSGNRPLAVVSEAHQSLVTERLKERGVRVKEGL